MISEKWDKRFIELAEHIALWSKDPSTKVGSVIVDKQKRIVSVGFNGYPKGIPDDDLDDRNLKYAKVLHAEINSILFAKQDLSGCCLYVSFTPCSQCASAIIQSGITRVVARQITGDLLERWQDKIKITQQMFLHSNVKLDYI